MSTPFTEEEVKTALRNVKYPGFSRDILSFGIVKEIEVRGPDLSLQVAVTSKDPAVPEKIRADILAELGKLPGVGEITISLQAQKPPETHHPGATGIEGVKRIIAVASGKGGVGKSTVAVNLAAALRATGKRVGLCDCDIYGPSISLMMGTFERPLATDENKIVPIEQFGLKLMSMGFLLEDDAPAVLRGPMVTRYTQQFLRWVEWGELDYLILDLPPGTGDIQLTIVQTVALSGAVIVTTPQEVALIDARKAASMFEKVNVPVLGIVENMSYFQCPSDGKRYNIFGTGGGEREAKRLGVSLLGQIPIDIATRESGDRGRPIVLADRANPVSVAFQNVAEQIDNIFSTPRI